MQPRMPVTQTVRQRSVIRASCTPAAHMACIRRAPVTGLFLGESPGFLGHLAVQSAPVDLHVADSAIPASDINAGAERRGETRSGGGSTHSDRAQLVVVHPQDPGGVHIR